MSLNNLDLKKLYYYVICVIAFFILIWGAVDFTGSSIGLVGLRNAAQIAAAEPETNLPIDKNEQFFDSFYQARMLYDRLFDSLARIIISGLVFGYCRFTVNKLEQQA